MKRLLIICLLSTVALAQGAIGGTAGIGGTASLGASGGGGGNSITVGTSQKTENVSASTSCTVTISPTAGQALFVTVISSVQITSCKTNNAGDDANWVIDWGVNVFSSVNMTACHILNVASGTTSVTVSSGSSPGTMACTATPLSGVTAFDTKTIPDPTFDGPGGAWTLSAKSVTPTAAKNAVIFGVAGNENGTAPVTCAGTGSYTTAISAQSGAPEWYTVPVYQIVTSTSGSYTPTGTCDSGFTFGGTIAFYH